MTIPVVTTMTRYQRFTTTLPRSIISTPKIISFVTGTQNIRHFFQHRRAIARINQKKLKKKTRVKARRRSKEIWRSGRGSKRVRKKRSKTKYRLVLDRNRMLEGEGAKIQKILHLVSCSVRTGRPGKAVRLPYQA